LHFVLITTLNKLVKSWYRLCLKKCYTDIDVEGFIINLSREGGYFFYDLVISKEHDIFLRNIFDTQTPNVKG